MHLDRFECVLGTARRETTSTQRPEQNRLDRRKRQPIHAQRGNQNELNHFSFSIMARRITHKKSRSTAASGLPTMDDRATSTIVTGWRRSC